MSTDFPPQAGIAPTIGARIDVPVAASRQYPFRVRVHERTRQGGWLVSSSTVANYRSVDGTEAILLDGSLAEIGRENFGEPIHAHLALSPDERWIALTAAGGLRLLDRRAGQRRVVLAHRPWDHNEGSDCLFTPDGLLWFVRPIGDEESAITVLEPEAGRAVAERQIEHPYGYYGISLHPAGQGVFIDVDHDAEGETLRRVELRDGRLEVESTGFFKQGVAGIGPSGKEFLACDILDARFLVLRSFPKAKALRKLDLRGVFRGDELAARGDLDQFEGGLFLAPGRYLLRTGSGRLLLIDTERMAVVGTVWPEGYRLHPFDNQLRPVADPSKAEVWSGGILGVHDAGAGEILVQIGVDALQRLDLGEAVRSFGTIV